MAAREDSGKGPGAGQPAGLGAWFVAAGLFGLAFLVRCLPAPRVFQPDGVQFFGMDAYYHMRRIAFAYRNFPATLDFDPYLNFPDGARAIWTPLFDWSLAGVLRLGGSGSSLADLEARVVWVPPLLGACTVLALYALARRHFGSGVALAAGLLLCVLPAHFHYSQLGFVDHHAAVALVTTALLAAAMALLDAPRDSLLAPALATGALLATCLLVWPGALLHVGLVEAGLVAWLLTRPGRADAVRSATALAIAQASAFALVAPFAAGSRWEQWSEASPVVLSLFQPWLFGAGLLFAGSCALVWRAPGPLGRSPTGRAASALAAAAALLAGSAALWPALPLGAREAWEWLSKSDQFQGLVSESVPLLRPRGAFAPLPALRLLSGFAVLVPVALVALAWPLRRRPAALLFLFWTAGLCAAALNQTRFVNSAGVALALLLAVSVQRLYRGLAPRAPGWRRPLLVGALSAGLLLLLWPSLASYLPKLQGYRAAAGWNGAPGAVAGEFAYQRAAIQLARWLRAGTPPAGAFMNPAAAPAYGVVAPWGLGHVIEYVGRRPTSATNFGDDVGAENFLRVARYYASTDEAEASAILDALRARYVVSQEPTRFLGAEPDAAATLHVLQRADGGAQAGTGRAALERHRLVYDSPSVGRKSGAPRFKVFEHVPGARITGRARPGAEVRVATGLRTNRGRQLDYEASTSADPQGRYALRVPYANVGSPPAVSVDPVYTVRCGGESAEVRVSESAVRAGADVRGPELQCGGSTPEPGAGP